jgi:hypothetical protein
MLGLQLRQVKCGPFLNSCSVCAFDGIGQPVAGLDSNVQRPVHGGCHTVKQLCEACTLHRTARGEHTDVAIARQRRCRLERRLYANERQVGVGASQFIDGEGGRYVAGDHQRVNPVFGPQPLGDPLCSLKDKFGRPLAIRCMGVVGQVDKVHLWQLGAQRSQNPQTADAAVKNANGCQAATLRRRRPRCP